MSCGAAILGGSCGPIACSTTSDVIGYNYPAALTGGAVDAGGTDSGAAIEAGGASGAKAIERTYPNLFHDLLAKSDTQISAKLEADYQQVFHGDAATEAIFVSLTATEAYVWDPRQNEILADGFSNALLVSVELDHKTEFDQLWKWADAQLIKHTGPLRDYVPWHCTLDGTTCYDEVAAEPQFCAATALWLADGRWGSAGSIDYRAAATRLTEAVFRSEPGASSSLGVLTGLVDGARSLPLSTPYQADAASTSTGVMEPAYFDIWAEKTGDKRAHALAASARAFWPLVTDASTGLPAAQASLDGVIATGDDVFASSSYPVLLAIALDSVWFQQTPFETAVANEMLTFFHGQPGPNTYAATYSLSGTPGSALSARLSLSAPLGALATPATVAYRASFVQAVWDATPDTGTSRKFGNLMYLLSSLILAGQLRVY